MKPLVKLNVFPGKADLYYKSQSGQEYLKQTTSDGEKMEEKLIKSVISALKTFNKPSKIELRMQQSQTKTAIRNHWPEKWQKSGWVNTRGKPVKYKDLWQEYMKLSEKHEIEVIE